MIERTGHALLTLGGLLLGVHQLLVWARLLAPEHVYISPAPDALAWSGIVLALVGVALGRVITCTTRPKKRG